jgi:hypothetical protein
VKVRVSTFEDAELEASTFDLGVSAIAFHWLGEEITLRKIVRLLRPGGWWVSNADERVSNNPHA